MMNILCTILMILVPLAATASHASTNYLTGLDPVAKRMTDLSSIKASCLVQPALHLPNGVSGGFVIAAKDLDLEDVVSNNVRSDKNRGKNGNGDNEDNGDDKKGGGKNGDGEDKEGNGGGWDRLWDAPKLG